MEYVFDTFGDSSLTESSIFNRSCASSSQPLNLGSVTLASIAPRILDFSPYSVSRLKSLDPDAPKQTTSTSIFGLAYEDSDEEDEAERGLHRLGDVETLIELPTLVPSEAGMFPNGLRTGAALPYVERQMGPILEGDQRLDEWDGLAGLTIDEERVMVVKVCLLCLLLVLSKC